MVPRLHVSFWLDNRRRDLDAVAGARDASRTGGSSRATAARRRSLPPEGATSWWFGTHGTCHVLLEPLARTTRTRPTPRSNDPATLIGARCRAARPTLTSSGRVDQPRLVRRGDRGLSAFRQPRPHPVPVGLRPRQHPDRPRQRSPRRHARGDPPDRGCRDIAVRRPEGRRSAAGPRRRGDQARRRSGQRRYRPRTRGSGSRGGGSTFVIPRAPTTAGAMCFQGRRAAMLARAARPGCWYSEPTAGAFRSTADAALRTRRG